MHEQARLPYGRLNTRRPNFLARSPTRQNSNRRHHAALNFMSVPLPRTRTPFARRVARLQPDPLALHMWVARRLMRR